MSDDSTPQSLEGAGLPTEAERIARRQHDGLIQSLFAVAMGLRTTRSMIEDREAVSLYLGAAADQIDRVTRQLRSYVFVLRPGLLSGWELERDLQSLARQLEAVQKISLALEIDSLAASTLAARLGPQDIVEAVREMVADTLCRSASKKMGLTLFLVNGAVVLEVRADGGTIDPELARRGPDVSNPDAPPEALRAAMEVESYRGEGTQMRVRVPLTDEAAGGPAGPDAGRGIRVVVVDDHEIVREGVRALIGVAGDIVVCGEAGSADEALMVAEWARPDVVVMDVDLAGGSGIDATRALCVHHPATRVLMLASFGDDEALFSSIMAGAAGFVLKEIKGHHLVEAIRLVAAGQDLLDPAVTRSVFERLRRTGTTASDEKLSRLSPQEERILSLVAEGKSNRQIAQALHLAEKTIKNYVSGILSKLEVSRRVEAAAYFTRRL